MVASAGRPVPPGRAARYGLATELMETVLPNRDRWSNRRHRPSFDPELSPWSLRTDPFEDILGRRVLAYLIDLVVIAIIDATLSIPLSILTVLSFGLLSFLWRLGPLVGLAYAILLIAAPGSATIGMRLMRIQVRRTDGGAPGFAHAILFALFFYLSCAVTGGLILLLPLVTARHRALHDYLSGTLLVRSDRAVFF